jgi:four helix bundle protein
VRRAAAKLLQHNNSVNNSAKETTMSENVVLAKSYRFALHIAELYKHLTDVKHEYVLSKGLLSDGTNVGAYVEAAQEAESRAGFAREISIALQKAGRTKFWLSLLHDARFLDDADYQAALEECLELKRLLGSILKSSK